MVLPRKVAVDLIGARIFEGCSILHGRGRGGNQFVGTRRFSSSSKFRTTRISMDRSSPEYEHSVLELTHRFLIGAFNGGFYGLGRVRVLLSEIAQSYGGLRLL